MSSEEMIKRKKILSALYSGLGGTGEYFFSLVEGDPNHVFDHYALFFGIEELRAQYVQKCQEKSIPFHFIKKKRGRGFHSYFGVYQHLRKLQPDVVITHCNSLIIPLFLFKLFYKKKLFFVEHQANHLKRFSEWLWTLLSMFLSSQNIYLSDVYQKQVQKTLGVFFCNQKSNIIQTGINLEKYTSSPATKDLKSGPIKMGMQSRLVKIKDHSSLLCSLEHLKNEPFYPRIQLLLAGDGAFRKHLEDLGGKLNISEKITFLGMLDENDLIEFMKKIDIYIHASLGETLSTAIIQAQALGLPIIASDVAGIHNHIHHNENGLLVPPQNPEKLSEALKNLIENDPLRKKIGTNAREYARLHHSSHKMFQQYANLIQKE